MHRQPQHDDHEGGEADAGPDAFLDLREGTCDKTSFRVSSAASFADYAFRTGNTCRK